MGINQANLTLLNEIAKDLMEEHENGVTNTSRVCEDCKD